MAPNVNEAVTPRGRPDQVAKRHSMQKPGWTETFPAAFDTYDGSSKFMQRCLLLSISQLMYYRHLLPTTAFKKRIVTDIIKCWSPECNDVIGNRLFTKLKGAGDALHLGYLKELIVVVGTNHDDHDDASEVFIWAMHYNDEDNTNYAVLSDNDGKTLARLEYRGEEYVKDQTRQILARIRTLCKEVLKPLPEGAFATLRVTYTSKAPRGYQAVGFQRSPTLYNLDPSARSVGIVGVATGYHKCFLTVESIFVEDEEDAITKLHEGELSDNSMNMTMGNLLVDPIENTRLDESMEVAPVAQEPIVTTPPADSSPEVANQAVQSRRSRRSNIQKKPASDEGVIQKVPSKEPRKRGRRSAVQTQEEVSPGATSEKSQQETTPPSKRSPPVKQAHPIKKSSIIYSGRFDKKTPPSSPPKKR